ncbi:alpha/beta-hydrolase [Viridothelium virens]|uniref:Alpha/beta-hydrolase n=1 Tax=Viridothelium virens TaxID=1048519 RepID=A0A6A6H383_VIRVR|nr:alpha/beta-hydrolase [Viridothelium virens]
MNEEKFTLKEIFTHKTSTHEFQIHWTRLGDPSKPALVFIHGFPWSSIVWQDLASALDTRYCIYLYDHPGFGQSPQTRRHGDNESDLDPTLILRAEASAALFKHWNLSKPAHVVAHDNGGLVSLRLFVEHGLKFASLCLINVVAIGPFGSPFFQLVANNQSVFQALPASFIAGLARSYIKTATHRPLGSQTEDLLVQQWQEHGSQGPARFLQDIVQAHHRAIGEVEAQYPRVGSQIPVKIIWGKNDSWIPSERASALSDALNARELVFLEDAGHLVQYDQPSKLASEITRWLTMHEQ